MKSIAITLICLALISCETTVSGTSTYKYEVVGTAATVNITIRDANGDYIQFNRAKLPWSFVFTKDNSYSYYAFISAQSNNESGTITVKIYRNEKEEKSATSTGAYCIASVFYKYH
jgi:hypothetical protein